jgi:diguanylate cyclase (GGDEF)-like protein
MAFSDRNGWNMIKGKWTRLFNIVPQQYKVELIHEINRERIDRLSVLSLFLFLIELVLAIFENRYDTRQIMLSFLIGNTVLIPLIWIIKKRGVTGMRRLTRAVCLAYSFITIAFGCALSLIVLDQMDLIHVYFISLLGVSAFVLTNAAESAVMFGAVYIVFALVVPHIRHGSQAVYYIQINALVFNCLAWLLGRMVYRNKIAIFLQKKMMDEKNSQLQDMVRKDSMTGLLNHDAAMEELRGEIARANRIGYPLSLVLADIDDFKSINDIHGHVAGDQVIKAIAGEITRTVRKTDVVGRYGGDEFIIILPATDKRAALKFTERLQAALRETLKEPNIKMTLSGGISQHDDESLDDFIRVADEKLYQAKSSGKNRYII